MTACPPILFCHYGDTRYLRYVLAAALRTNPDREVVLLGDAANAWLARHLPIRHVPFASLEGGPELAEFDRVYRAVQGPRHVPIKGGRDWLNFVFRRWFYVLNHLRSTGTTAFWHFDSDTMLLRPLAPSERHFAGVDCTQQCEGACVNGWVSGPDLITRYVRSINEIFTRRAYLDEQQREFDTIHPNWAFTEMRAWELFRNEAGLVTARLSDVRDGSMFDDCLCHDHGFETEFLRHGQPVKRVRLGDGGSFWVRRLADGAMVQLNSLNLSWVPDYLFAQVERHLEEIDGSGGSPGGAEGPTLANSPIPLRFLPERLCVSVRLLAKRILRRPHRWP